MRFEDFVNEYQFAHININGKDMTLYVGAMIQDACNKDIVKVDIQKIDQENFTEMREVDLKYPVILVWDKSGIYKIVDGNHRIYYARQRNMKYIEAYVFGIDELDQYNKPDEVKPPSITL